MNPPLHHGLELENGKISVIKSFKYFGEKNRAKMVRKSEMEKEKEKEKWLKNE